MKLMNHLMTAEIELWTWTGDVFIARVQIERRDNDPDSSFGTYRARIQGNDEEGWPYIDPSWSPLFQYPRAAGAVALLAKALHECGYDPCKQQFRELSPEEARELKDVP